MATTSTLAPFLAHPTLPAGLQKRLIFCFPPLSLFTLEYFDLCIFWI